MNKKYVEEDLISFGNYLLSPQRVENLMSSPEYNEEGLVEMMEAVLQQDLDNWKEINKKKLDK